MKYDSTTTLNRIREGSPESGRAEQVSHLYEAEFPDDSRIRGKIATDQVWGAAWAAAGAAAWDDAGDAQEKQLRKMIGEEQ